MHACAQAETEELQFVVANLGSWGIEGLRRLAPWAARAQPPPAFAGASRDALLFAAAAKRERNVAVSQLAGLMAEVARLRCASPCLPMHTCSRQT